MLVLILCMPVLSREHWHILVYAETILLEYYVKTGIIHVLLAQTPRLAGAVVKVHYVKSRGFS